ncbi:putative lipoprotein [Dickeya chrysanthemi Ech1591]|uniref:Putative lipoprotein n=1 Tax=Dickeya chrysanthemi (strain Ech1591) TaxID=561229 RepID=C6CLE3_DICC1|nr:DUF2291 domain-containing protein [Dickeya chrysanthemi]ACT08447.1 putative lipoprotein [Dickeya chrysanthemi Ech1591]
MSRHVWLALAILGLGGCRIVSQQELADLRHPPNPHMANIGQTWQQKLVPQLVNEARPLAALMKDLQSSSDMDAACKQFGYRSQDENACVFTVRITGTVEQLDTASRSGKMRLKDADGGSVSVQLGPTLRGTDLRDSYKGASYQDFNDQVLYGDFGRGINQQALAMIQAAHPQVGDRLDVVGVFSSWDIPQAVPDITPAQITRDGKGG